nr:MAG TPA: hypothetical protein [Caudoviricetes sp.]
MLALLVRSSRRTLEAAVAARLLVCLVFAICNMSFLLDFRWPPDTISILHIEAKFK